MLSDSESSSDNKEIEYLLYSQLYFGNCSKDATDCVNSYESPSEEINEDYVVEDTLDEKSFFENSCIKKFPPPSTNIPSEKNVHTRERNPSICSTGSISGKQALDSLYCNAGDSDDLSPIEENSDIEIVQEFGPTSQNSVANIPKPLSKYNMSISKFSKSKSSPKWQDIIEIGDSSPSDDTKVTPLHAQHVKGSVSHIEVDSCSSDQSIICIGEKDMQKTDNKSNENPVKPFLLSDSSTDFEDEIGVPSDITLFYNVPKEMQKSFPVQSLGQRSDDSSKGNKSKIVYTKSRKLSKKIPSCLSWTSEMTSLYDSDIPEDLTVRKVHSAQSNNARCWKILREDYPSKKKKFRYFNQEPRCQRCRQFGHERINCPKVPLCPYCCSSKHISIYQCPYNCCLRCGSEPHGYCAMTSFRITCDECGLHGHHNKLCPDLWRRFHNTTEGTTPIMSNDTSEKKIPWCCNCAKRGHYGYECHYWDDTQKYIIVPTTANCYESPFAVPDRQQSTGLKRKHDEAPDGDLASMDEGSLSKKIKDNSAKWQMPRTNKSSKAVKNHCAIKKRDFVLKRKLYNKFETLHCDMFQRIASVTSKSLKIYKTEERILVELVGTKRQIWLAQNLMIHVCRRNVKMDNNTFTSLLSDLRKTKMHLCYLTLEGNNNLKFEECPKQKAKKKKKKKGAKIKLPPPSFYV